MNFFILMHMTAFNNLPSIHTLNIHEIKYKCLLSPPLTHSHWQLPNLTFNSLTISSQPHVICCQDSSYKLNDEIKHGHNWGFPRCQKSTSKTIFFTWWVTWGGTSQTCCAVSKKYIQIPAVDPLFTHNEVFPYIHSTFLLTTWHTNIYKCRASADEKCWL